MKLYTTRDIPLLLREAADAKGALVIGIMASTRGCPWCIRLVEEQLLPRMRARERPAFKAVEVDLNDTRRSLGGQLVGKSPKVLTSPAEWTRFYNLRFAPSLGLVGPDLQTLTAPLIGYTSSDFYGADLDAAIHQAADAWKKGFPS